MQAGEPPAASPRGSPPPHRMPAHLDAFPICISIVSFGVVVLFAQQEASTAVVAKCRIVPFAGDARQGAPSGRLRRFALQAGIAGNRLWGAHAAGTFCLCPCTCKGWWQEQKSAVSVVCSAFKDTPQQLAAMVSHDSPERSRPWNSWRRTPSTARTALRPLSTPCMRPLSRARPDRTICH